ncbi:CLUMA_CG012093, isoform A [Clunio marinus]|uniref:CLUMA_CG012093, isoform A n=1 Tax=Clunio marinus TaxID=568069 RepID=A0A1J1IGE5_9DIPT|nr:CLUMA_CG012093, isoform A [Clunio marinus]
MSFFVREKTISRKTKKFSSIKKPVENKQDQDEELDSENEEINGDHKSHPEISDEEDTETPDAKRLRLAKKYLDEIKKSDDEDEHVSKKLKLDYLDSIGKLKKQLAENILGIDEENLVTLKHKLQNQPITCLCLSSDNNILFSGSKTGKILKWNIKDKKQIGCISLDSSVICIALSSDNEFLAVSDKSNKIFIYNPSTLKKIHTFDGHRGIVTGLVFRKDSHQMFSCSDDRSVKVWSLDEMVYVETLFGHQNQITSVDALSKERALTSGGADGTIRLWKIVDESQLVYNGHSGSIDCVKFITEEFFLSSGDDGSLCLWNVGKKKPIAEQKLAHGTSSTGIANWISAIGTLVNTDLIASGSCDGFIRVWKLEKNFREIKLKFEIPVRGFVNSLTFTSDGSKLIAGIGQEHRLGRWWKLKDGKNVILVIPLKSKE